MGGRSHCRPPPKGSIACRMFSFPPAVASASRITAAPSILFGGRMFWRPPPIWRRKPSAAAVCRYFGGNMIWMPPPVASASQLAAAAKLEAKFLPPAARSYENKRQKFHLNKKFQGLFLN